MQTYYGNLALLSAHLQGRSQRRAGGRRPAKESRAAAERRPEGEGATGEAAEPEAEAQRQSGGLEGASAGGRLPAGQMHGVAWARLCGQWRRPTIATEAELLCASIDCCPTPP